MQLPGAVPDVLHRVVVRDAEEHRRRLLEAHLRRRQGRPAAGVLQGAHFAPEGYLGASSGPVPKK